MSHGSSGCPYAKGASGNVSTEDVVGFSLSVYCTLICRLLIQDSTFFY